MVAVLVVGACGLIWSFRFFSAKHGQQDAPKSSNAATVANTPVHANVPKFSDAWRLVGTAQLGGQSYVLIADSAGRLRYESPSMFVAMGPQTIGDIDGAKVTRYSGGVVQAGKSEIKK